ncbi:MAG: glycosyl hydrolase family 65 protein [Acidimicrobiales bacterium]
MQPDDSTSPAPEEVDEWILRYDGFDPSSESLREALCTLGNGHFATRGAAPEATADRVHYPGTYVAGLYNRRVTPIAGRTVENESIVNVPNWLPLNFQIDDGPWFDVGDVELLDYRQELDLRRAIVTRSLRLQDAAGRVTRVDQRRFVSMSDPHRAGLETLLCAENWSGRLTVRSGIDGRVSNGGVARYRQFDENHLVDVNTRAVSGAIALTARTSQSDVSIAEVATTRVVRAGTPVHPPLRVIEEPGFIAHELSIDVTSLETITIEKTVSLFTSKDRSISDPLTEACSWNGRQGTFTSLLDAHIGEWDDLWKRFSLEVEGDGEETRLALHLHIFHLLQTTSRNTVDLDVGVPARGLHGEAYRGHIFWDELFIFPYLNLHLPELVRSLLLYRYRRLPEARWAAHEAGFRGAMYPWQSGSNGREEAQVVHLNPLSGRWLPDASHLQRHINAAIAYNVWQYYQVTADIEFMANYGAEMILEVCRFWASIARFDPALDRYEIVGVMGPDEYHDGYVGAAEPGLANNAYTNVMAVWVLCRGLDMVDLLPEPRRSELFGRLSLDEAEIAHWDDVSRKMRIVFHEDGVISQFEGYEELAELDWDSYRDRYPDISRLDRLLEEEGDTPNAYKASKQADVLMLFYLLSADALSSIFERLGYPFDSETIPRSIGYYLQRTSHGSTLSRVVHSWVLARSDRQRSWEFFEDALRSDLDDIQGGTTGEGVHLGAMAGTVDVVQRCYLGIVTRDDVIWFDPLLPTEVRSLSLDICYRRRWMNVTVADGQFTLDISDSGEGAVRVGLDGEVVELSPGDRRQLTL